MTCSISFTSGFFFWLPAIVLFSFVQRNTFFGFVIFVLCNPKIQSLRTCGGHPTAAAAACRTNLQAQFAKDLIWKSIQLCSFRFAWHQTGTGTTLSDVKNPAYRTSRSHFRYKTLVLWVLRESQSWHRQCKEAQISKTSTRENNGTTPSLVDIPQFKTTFVNLLKKKKRPMSGPSFTPHLEQQLPQGTKNLSNLGKSHKLSETWRVFHHS